MTPNGSMTLHTMLLTTSALVASAMLAATAAHAGGPTGGKVVVGSATITTPSSTQTVVDQSSKAALIDWNSFSIPVGSSVVFDQPTSGSLTVNRVTGTSSSAIYGDLLANGNIWLINANGILFGRGSQVNVGALLATTSDISDEDFKKGRYRFTKPGSANASVINQGTITAGQGGSVVLSASDVANQGVITANLGTVVLGGAREFTVDMDGDNLLRYQITAPVTNGGKAAANGAALVSNSGTIAAAGGTVLLTARAARNVQDDVINNTGQIEATSVSSHNGEIDFDAGPDGTVNVGGTVDASGKGAGETGGAINITGGTVNVANGTTIDASGDAGGGTIQIGGGLHGKGTIANAKTTNIGSANINANAITSGNGGTVAIWSNGNTSFAGTVSATGGSQGGNGGFVETSGENLNVGANGKVITSAAKGATGDWLLDPANIDIVSGGTDGIGGSNIDPNTIIAALGTTNVKLEATDYLTIDSEVDYSSSNSLSLLAGRDIVANAGIQNSGTGDINLIAGWNGTTTNPAKFTNPGVYGNNGGSIYIGGEGASGDVAIGSAGGTTTFAGNGMTLDTWSGYAQAGYHGAGGGNIVVDLTGGLQLNADYGGSGYALLGNGSMGGDVNGNISGNISINAQGTTTINVGEGGGPAYAWIGNVANEGSMESGNVSLITGSLDSGGLDFGQVVSTDLGTTSQPGSGGNVLVGITSPNYETDIEGGDFFDTPNNLTILTSSAMVVQGSLQNAGTGNITLIAGWDGVTTNPSQLTNSGVYGNSDAELTIGGRYAYGDVAVGSAGGTTLLEAQTVNVEADNGYAQAGYHGVGGGDIDINVTSDVNLNGYNFESVAMIGNGSVAGDVTGNVTGNISINAPNTFAINLGEGGGSAWLGNATSGSGIESGNVSLIAGTTFDDNKFGDPTALGNMLITDMGTTSNPGSGGDVVFALTNPLTDFINLNLNMGSVEYDSPHSLTILSTGNLTLPYSIQNDGTGNITILAGWNPAVAPANVLTTPGAFGNLTSDYGGEGNPNTNAGAFVWVVGFNGYLVDSNGNTDGFGPDVNSGLGVAIGSKGGTTTVGGAQIYLEGLSGYAQIGYHNTGGTGAIDVIANGTPGTSGLTGVYACFDGNANICVIGGRNGATDDNNDPTYAQIGDLGLGVSGTSSADINISTTGSIAVAGGGIYDNVYSPSDPGIPDAYGMIGNGDGAQTVAQTVSGNITINDGGQLNFASSTGEGSDAWLGNRTGSDGLSSGNLTIFAASESDTGGVSFSSMIDYALGTTSVAGSGGDVTIGMTQSDIDLKNKNGFFYDSPNNLTLATVGSIYVVNSLENSGTGNITLAAGWDGTTNPLTLAVTSGSYGLNGGQIMIGGSGAVGDVAVGTAGGTLTALTGDLNVDGVNGYAQLGYHGAGTGNIVVDATGNFDFSGGNTSADTAQIGNGSLQDDVDANVGGNITVNVAGDTTASNTTGLSFLGNLTASGWVATGNVTVLTGTGTFLNYFLQSDLGTVPGAGGNVFIGFTDTEGTPSFGGLDYNSSNSFTVASAGDLDITGNIQNAGSGAVTAVAGWDGQTVGTALQLLTANAYGANGGTVTIGGEGQIEGQTASVGSAYGLTTVLTKNLNVESDNGVAQIGFDGVSSGNIDVYADGNVTVDALNGTYAQIGNGGSNVAGNVGGAVNVVAGGNVTVETNEAGSAAAIGNISTGSQSGNIYVYTGGSTNVNALATYNDNGVLSDAFIGNGSLVVTAGGATGNITIDTGALGITATGDGSQAFVGDGVRFKSSGTTGGDINIAAASVSLEANEADSTTSQARIANRGSGTVVGDYDIVTSGDIDLDATDTNLAAIGNGEGGSGTSSGSITVQAGGNLSLTAEDSGEARIAGGVTTDTDINVTAGGDITMAVTGNATDFGSGSVLIGNLGAGVTGGNITVASTGGITLNATEDGSAVQIGNVENGVTGDVTGNVMVSTTNSETGSISLNAGGANSYILIGDGGLGSGGGGSANGNVTVDAAAGFAASATNTSAYVQVGNGGWDYTGATGGTVSITGTNAVDGVTLTTDGQGAGIEIGNGGLQAVGDSTGSVDVTASKGELLVSLTGQDTFLHIGNGGVGSSGDASGAIDVEATNSSIVGTLTGSGTFQIGNGGDASTGSATGDITVTALNALDLTTYSGYPDGSVIQIGNGGNFSNVSAANGFTDSGNIFIRANSVTLETKNTTSDIQIGNGGDCAGANNNAACAGTPSNVSTSGPVTFGGNITVDAANSLSMLADSTSNGVWIGNGGDRSAAGLDVVGGALSDTGSINVTVGTDTAPGTLTMETGTPGGSSVRIGNGGYLSGNLATADGGLTLGGDITVDVLGGTTDGGLINMEAQGTTASGVTIGNIGSGFTNGTVSGTINVDDDGLINLTGVPNISGSLIGNTADVAGDATGNVTVDAFSQTGDISYSMNTDLPGGDFTLDLSGDQLLTFYDAVNVTSSHTLSITNAGSIVIAGSLQNAGSGNIMIDSTGSDVTIGGAGATGGVSVGSAGGLTSITTDNLTLDAANGYAQLGFNGASGGNITVMASDTVNLEGEGSDFAQIGNGTTFGSNSAGGNVSVSADALTNTNSTDIAGNSADITVTGVASGIGDYNQLQVTVNDLAITTNNGYAFVYSTQGVNLGVGEDGIDTGAGGFVLAAAGPITQTQAITAAYVNFSTTTGAITLTDSSNAIAGASFGTTGTDNASLTDSSNLSIASADVGGTLTLNGGGTVGQSGAITANGLDVTTTNGAITLTNSGNEIGSAAFSTSGSDDASLTDASGLTITSANVGGTLTIVAGGAVGQSGAITASSIDVSTTAGAITLTNADNSIGAATLSTAGGDDDAALDDAANLTIAGANVGGTLVLNGDGTIGQTGAIIANAMDITTSGGDVDLENTGNSFYTSHLSVGGTGDVTLVDTSSLGLVNVSVGGTLTVTANGGIDQTGALTADTLNLTSQTAGIDLENTGNAVNTASFTTSGTNNATFTDASALEVSGANVGGTLQLTAAGITQSSAITAATLNLTSTGGDVTLTNAGNAFGTTNLSMTGTDAVTLYDSSNLIVAGAVVGGDVTLLTEGNLTFDASVDTAGGSVLAVAGWDGETTNPSSLTTGSAFGNNSGSITVGGTGAYGNVSVGSASGTTVLAGDNITVEADKGYAQIGTANSSGNISVYANGNVALTGGANADDFAQIGNGGYNVAGNESGNILVDASGNVALNGGAGQEAYAQIGHGGAESNSGSEGYSDTGLITVDGNVVSLAAGTGAGSGSYAQIGMGGYLSGHNLSGTATLGGNVGGATEITVNAQNGVTLAGGSAESYAQIGNGGDLVNSNAANNANGTIGGDIDVTVANVPAKGAPDPITVTAGAGADSFAQIGNGGRGMNMPASGATVSFNISGNVSIADLTLTGSDTGTDAYAQVGDGDASKTGAGNVSGDITIGPGIDVTINEGTAPGTDSMIGNDTGSGTITGSIAGYTPPDQNTTSPGETGTVASTQQTPITPTDTDTGYTGQSPDNDNPQQPTNTPAPNTPAPTPLDQLVDNGPGGSNSEGDDPTDDLSTSLGLSLDPGSHKAVTFTTKSIIPGVLTQIVAESANGPHGVPPADEDYSSWGNEALWRW